MTAREFEDLKVTSVKISCYPIIAQAAISGNIPLIKQRLAKGDDPDRPTKQYLDYTPLMWAIGWDRFKAAKALLEAGADIEAKDADDRTALHQAIGGHRNAGVEFLIGHGADIEAPWNDGKGYIPRKSLQVAIEHMDLEIIEMLLQAGAETTFCILPFSPGKKGSTRGGVPMGVCDYILRCHSQLRNLSLMMLEIVKRVRPDEYMDHWMSQPGSGLTP